jgi:translocation and assembly module TamB
MRRFLKICGFTILGILLLLIGLSAYLQTESGQTYLTKKVNQFLKSKIDTPFKIDKIKYSIPDWLSLEGVYFADQQGDTLLAGKKLYIDIDMWALLQNKVDLNEIDLENISVNINRTLPDTTFNFNYILEAFTKKKVAQKPETDSKSTPLTYEIGEIKLKNVAIKYLDDVTGVDAKLFLANTQTAFSAFDPSKSKFHLANTSMNGGNLKLKMYAAIPQKEKAKNTDSLDLAFNTFSAKNLKIDFADENSKMVSKVDLGSLFARGEKLYLSSEKVHLKSLEIKKTIADIALLKNNNVEKPANNVEKTEQNNWQVLVEKIIFDQNNIKFSNQNAVAQNKGIDFNNLNINKLSLNAERLSYSQNNISGWIYSGSFKEKSGFELQSLQTDFAYTNRQAFLKKLLIKTPQTIIRDEVILGYASFDELQNNIGNVSIKSSLKNSQIGFEDILLIMPEYAKGPPFKGNESSVLKINGSISGKINNLQIANTTVSGLDKAKLIVSGNITGLPNAEKMVLNLNVNELSITKNDIHKLITKENIPTSIELPERVSVVGKINGKLENLLLDTQIKSDLGNASFKGKLVNITADKNQQYEGDISFENFEMGKFLKQPDQIGKLSIIGKINGNGFDPKTLNANFDGTVQQLEYKGYNYKNAVINGSLANQLATIKGNISDPNIALTIDSKIDISKEFPSINGSVYINELNLKTLGFYPENLGIRGDIDIAMEDTNPDNPTGTITINKGTLIQNGKPIKIENTTLTARNTADGKKITIDAPFLKANLKGDFNYLQIPDIFIANINRYFLLPDIAVKPISEPYSLDMDVKFANHPAIQSFLPLLNRLDTARFVAKIDSKSDTLFRANLNMPYMEYDTIKVKNTNLKLMGDANKMVYTGGFDDIVFTDFQIRKTSLDGEVSDNIASFKVIFNDAQNKKRNEVAGRLQNVDSQYRINLNKGGLLLNYVPWQVDSTGYLQYGNLGLLANQFHISRGEQDLKINNTTSTPNGPINITTDSLEIQNFVSLFSPDSTMASGKMDGQILVSNYMTDPSIKGDMVIKNFFFQQKPIGDLNLNVFNESATKITAKVTILNENNDLVLDGSYYLNTKNNLAFALTINKLSAETVEAFSFGELKRAKGSLTGKADIKGSTTAPKINGNLSFDAVAFDLTAFGGRYLIDKQALVFDNQTIRLNQFVVTDTLKQPLKVNGIVSIANMPSVQYDLEVDAQNFLVLNSTRKDNDFVYGKGIVDADLTLKGVSSKVKIDGDIKVRENSNISVIVPNSDSDQAENEGVVIFVDNKNQKLESIANDTLVEKPFVNDFVSEISLNIEADEKSEFTIVVDEINGDNLKVRGTGRLNAGINNAGKPYVLGSFDLAEGSYGITFEVLKKEFLIQKGSSIIWSGDPMNGDLNITAVYKVSTSPLDLMENVSTENKELYRQKMNFDVKLIMSGKLSSPIVEFEIRPSEATEQRLISSKVLEDVKTRLDALQNKEKNTNQEDEINKQVFALLILNRFFSEKSSDFFSTSTGGTNAAAFARQSVSKLLSDQLNQITSGLIKGVDLDVNLSSSQDYFGGVSSTRTDLSLGLSKAFFNDKIEIKVGRNFELENNTNISRNPSEVFDNLTVNYKLSKDGKFLFKAFRKNQFQSVLEGFIVETGVGFSISRDYSGMKDLFMRRRKENE